MLVTKLAFIILLCYCSSELFNLNLDNLFSFDDFYFEASLVTNLILIILLSYVLFDFNLDNLGIYLIRSILVQSCKPKKNKSKNRLKSRLATDLVLIIHTTIFSLRAVR